MIKNIFNLFGSKEKPVKSLLDFQDQWEILVDKAFSDYNSLNKSERLWFNIQSLISSVDNGGLISHYYNSGADHNNDTIEDLEFLGFNKISELLKSINNHFPNGKPPEDINERNRIIESWPDGEYDEIFSGFDEIFYENEEKLEQTLVKSIEDNIIN